MRERENVCVSESVCVRERKIENGIRCFTMSQQPSLYYGKALSPANTCHCRERTAWPK